MGRWRSALRLVGIGWYVGICIVLGLVAGRWLDSMLGTNLLWLIGLLFGIFLAFYGMYQMLQPLLKNKRDEEND